MADGVLDFSCLGLASLPCADAFLKVGVKDRDGCHLLRNPLRFQELIRDIPQLLWDATHTQPRVPEMFVREHVDLHEVLVVLEVIQCFLPWKHKVEGASKLLEG